MLRNKLLTVTFSLSLLLNYTKPEETDVSLRIASYEAEYVDLHNSSNMSISEEHFTPKTTRFIESEEITSFKTKINNVTTTTESEFRTNNDEMLDIVLTTEKLVTQDGENLKTLFHNFLDETEHDIKKSLSEDKIKQYVKDEIGDQVKNVIKEEVKDEFRKEMRKKINNYRSKKSRKSDVSKELEEEVKNGETLVDYPYTVSIQKKGSHYCTGAILDNFWVITAATDMYNVRESIKLYNVRLGAVDCKKGLKFPLKMLEIHPSFVKGQPHYDLAMVKMAYPIKFSDYVKPIPISHKKGWTDFVTTYWPRVININGGTIALTQKEKKFYKRLRVCNQQSLPWDSCYNKVLKSSNIALSESSRCMRPATENYNRCKPEVGAPVVTLDGLYGVTSGWISADCDKNLSPTIFTVINGKSVTSWINHLLING